MSRVFAARLNTGEIIVGMIDEQDQSDILALNKAMFVFIEMNEQNNGISFNFVPVSPIAARPLEHGSTIKLRQSSICFEFDLDSSIVENYKTRVKEILLIKPTIQL